MLMELAFFIVAMLALWLFIRIDQRRFRDDKPKPLSRADLEAGFTPGSSMAWWPYLGCGLLSAIGAYVQFAHPSAPPFVGRWSSLKAMLHGSLGPYGQGYAFSAMALTFLALALLTRSRQRRTSGPG